MTKPILDESLRKLEKFLAKYNLKKILKKPKFKVSLKKIHKKFHAFLIYHHHLCSVDLWPKECQKSQQFSDYLNETVSDLSQSIFCYCHGSYKASFLLLRSAIENFVKTIGIHQNEKVLTIKVVHDLIDVVSKTNVVSNTTLINKHYTNLKSSYKILCKYVHTADASFMTKTTMFGVYPYFDDIKGDEVEKLLTKTIGDFLSILSCIFPAHLRQSLHHTEIDIIKDSLNKEIKSFITSKTNK